MRTAGLLCLLLLTLVLQGEWRIWEIQRGALRLKDFDQVEFLSRSLQAKVTPFKLSDGRDVDLSVSWSAGNKSYRYLRVGLAGDEKLLLDFWSTKSLVADPAVWLVLTEQNRLSQIVTYQPMALPSDTPFGTTEAGFKLWSSHGSFLAKPVGVSLVNLLLRNPLPFQD